MSGTSKSHQFRSLKSPKIDETTDFGKQPLKNDKKCLQVTVFSDFSSQLGPRGGSTDSLFRLFESFGQSWGPKASKSLPKSPRDHPRSPFLPTFDRFLTDVGAMFRQSKGRRGSARNRKKANVPSCFFTICGEKSAGRVQNFREPVTPKI